MEIPNRYSRTARLAVQVKDKGKVQTLLWRVSLSSPIEHHLYLAQAIYLYSLRVFFIYSTPCYLLCHTCDPSCYPLIVLTVTTLKLLPTGLIPIYQIRQPQRPVQLSIQPPTWLGFVIKADSLAPKSLRNLILG